MTKPKIGTSNCDVITLNYNTDEMTLSLGKKLGNVVFLHFILVDNSSSSVLKQETKNIINVYYLDPQKNLGFAGGVNYGIKHAKGEWIVLLNSDAKTDGTTIKSLIDEAIKNNAVVAAPKLIGTDGKAQTTVGMFSSFVQHPINWLFMRPRYVSPSETLWVHAASGGALLIHRSVFDRVGMFDDKNFFMYFEDMDFSWRLHKAGIGILYVPNCVIEHIGGASADKNPKKKSEMYMNSLNNYLLKHRGPIVVWLNSLFHFLR